MPEINYMERGTVSVQIAVVIVIIKKSRNQNQIIIGSSLREIKNALKKHYDMDVTERHILNIIRSLGRIVIKEKDPRNHRKTLYIINQNLVEEVTLMFIKNNKEKRYRNNVTQGVVCFPLLSSEKKEFLAICHNY